MQLLGTRIDSITLREAREKIRGFFADNRTHIITTPNAEMLVYAYRHPEFQSLINGADLNVCDSMGVFLASRFVDAPLTERITGTDLVPELCRLAQEMHCGVFLLGGYPQSLSPALARFQAMISNLEITGESGGNITQNTNGSWQMDGELLDRIRAAKPAVLVVGLGHGKQEAWLHDHLKDLLSVRVAIGVGGAIDYYGGTIRRAPQFMRTIGFEWLWRLAIEPKRISRIFTAVVVFPFLVIKEKIFPIQKN